MHTPRYEVRRLDNGDYILWDTITGSRVWFAGPYATASEATRRCESHNRAWERQPTRRVPA